MKKLLTIFFLSAWLLSSTEMYQFIKLPVLVTHFQKHRNDNPQTSLWSFLCEHYANGNVFDADHEEDMKLPFKTHEVSSYIVFTAFPPPALPVIEKPVVTIRERFRRYQVPCFNNDYLGCIWQPPKNA